MRGAGEDVDAQATWEALDRAVIGLGHGLKGVDVIEHKDRDVAIVRRRRTSSALRDLSDGYQSMLVIILDLVIRYVYLSPLDHPMRRAATVVIDEVDLHLHPRWQRRIIGQLTKLFPDTQLILTTHSPAVVQSAIDFGHQVLVLRQKEGVSSLLPLAARDLRSLRGAQIDTLLVDGRLFGVGSRYSPKYGVIEQKVRRLRKKMDAGTATEEERAELIEGLDASRCSWRAGGAAELWTRARLQEDAAARSIRIGSRSGATVHAGRVRPVQGGAALDPPPGKFCLS